MKFSTLLYTIVFVLVVAVAPRAALATANTKVALVQDVASGGVGTADMLGPTGYGFLNFNQNANGDLRLVVSLKNADPNTEYKGVFLVCGPTHASACSYIDVGDLTTNGQGNGNATMWVPVATLQASPFGSGSRTDHFDLLKGVGDQSAGVYVAAGVDYIVP